ncbi:hypothetical protein LOK49_LG07G02105 [Camellia lanceoleosa]|uniref:Uncharacterized protein n=1 Tax=Camellia lanceoleosa TaxID=1840588 RepID=A0ACC0H832_9ERIC|nr:hypothetical protein LOK49_LG07G02105 [Camellia lanceoleosa]
MHVLDMKAIILGKYHYVLYFLALAMQPRMLLTVDENLKPLSVPVRVGQVVDVVGQAGSNFQDHYWFPDPLNTGFFWLLVIERSLLLRSIFHSLPFLKALSF